MKLFDAVKLAVKDFSEDECMISGAAMAYYTVFALPPLLALLFFAAEAAGVSDRRISQFVQEQLGLPKIQQSGSLGDVAGREASSSTSGSMGIISKVVGVALLIFSATGLFAQLQYALNKAWEVEPDPERGGLKNFITKRLLSAGMIVVIGFLLLVSLVLTTVVDEIMTAIQGSAPGPAVTAIGIAINALVTLVIATLLFAAMFKTLPDVKMQWRDLWVGSAITAILFVLGKTLLGVYLHNSQMGSSWGGAAASLITMLVWVYYTSLIVLFGAELTQAWAKLFGSGIEPAEGAVRKVEEKRYERGTARSRR